MKPINMTDGGRGKSHHKQNPQYTPRRMNKFSDREIKNAIRIYKKALKNCEDELRDRRYKRDSKRAP